MIAPLGPDDVADAVALWTDAGLTRPWNDAAGDFLRAVAGPASAVLGIRADGALVGSAMVGHDGHRGWVYYLAVAASARGRGLGRDLMAAAEAWLVANGWEATAPPWEAYLDGPEVASPRTNVYLPCRPC